MCIIPRNSRRYSSVVQCRVCRQWLPHVVTIITHFRVKATDAVYHCTTCEIAQGHTAGPTCSWCLYTPPSQISGFKDIFYSIFFKAVTTKELWGSGGVNTVRYFRKPTLGGIRFLASPTTWLDLTN